MNLIFCCFVKDIYELPQAFQKGRLIKQEESKGHFCFVLDFFYIYFFNLTQTALSFCPQQALCFGLYMQY